MDDAQTTIIVGAIVAVLAILSVILRFCVRYFKRHGFSWDDWLILFSILSIIALVAVNLYGSCLNPDNPETSRAYRKTNAHSRLYTAADLDPNGGEVASSNGKIEYSPSDVIYTKVTYISTILYFTLTSTTKLSILFLYNRIFSINESFRRQVIGMIVVVAAFFVGTVVADLLNCIPIEYSWLNSLDDPRYCFNFNHFWLASGIVEAVIDIAILLLPIPVVSQLRVSGSKKWGIIGVFLVGIFVILSGVVKVVLSYEPNSRDPSFGQTQVWTTVHLCTGIICACMPVCWPLIVSLKKLDPSIWFAKISPKSWASRDKRTPGNRYPVVEAGEEFDLGVSDTRILRETYA